MKNHIKIYSRGFTLLELIIVIMILGVLAAISIIAFLNVIQTGNKNSNAITGKIIKNAVFVYITESNDTNLSQCPHTNSSVLINSLQSEIIVNKDEDTDIKGTYGPYIESGTALEPREGFTGWEVFIDTSNSVVTVEPGNTNTVTVN